jgi:hypothetical protein
MKGTVAELYEKLTPDVRREELGFSSEIQSAQDEMFEATRADDISAVLAAWLHRFQPCLFGRLSAKLDLIRYCILSESDLIGSDEAIREKIQTARSLWTKEGFEGTKSGFVILAVSTKLANAEPNTIMKQLAQRLCRLYLLQDNIEPDIIYTDEIFLEKPGAQRATWKWLAGVNVFSANADRRWWQDHRIPGGLGFSVNSVGHMVKCGMLSKALQQMDDLVGAPAEPLAVTKIDSLEKALEFAMRTIWGASDAASGKSTELLPIPSNRASLPVQQCPAELPHFLADRNFCEYRGYYHTDVTIPSDYFRPDVMRPDHVIPIPLDFTYLFRSHVDNPAHITMGSGRRIRGADADTRFLHSGKGDYEELPISRVPRLLQALQD